MTQIHDRAGDPADRADERLGSDLPVSTVAVPLQPLPSEDSGYEPL